MAKKTNSNPVTKEYLDLRLGVIEHEIAEIKGEITGMKGEMAGIKEEITGMRNEFVDIKVEIMGELKTMREEQAAHSYSHQRMTGELEDHEDRIGILESAKNPQE